MRKIVLKNWGCEEWLVNNDKYCGKILYLNQDKRCSLHRHKIKEETFYILEGEIELETRWEDEQSQITILSQGDTWEILVGQYHRFKAINGLAILIEFSTHHDDNDVERLELSPE